MFFIIMSSMKIPIISNSSYIGKFSKKERLLLSLSSDELKIIKFVRLLNFWLMKGENIFITLCYVSNTKNIYNNQD